MGHENRGAPLSAAKDGSPPHAKPVPSDGTRQDDENSLYLAVEGGPGKSSLSHAAGDAGDSRAPDVSLTTNTPNVITSSFAAATWLLKFLRELCWSHSQQHTLDNCPRARFWSSEIAPLGNSRGAPEIARKAFRLKTLTTLEMQLGIVLHRCAAEIALAIRNREPMPHLRILRARVSAHMNYVWSSMRDRYDDWLKAPKKVPMLIERYYGRGPSRDRAKVLKERLERAVTALRGLALWGEVAACDPADVLTVDSLESYELSDPAGGAPVKVWAAPDLVIRTGPDEPWEVIDFKTGRSSSKKDFDTAVQQVHTYAVFLRHGARVIGPEDWCKGRLIYLGDGTEFEFFITASEIDAAEARIRDSAKAMANLRESADALESVAASEAHFQGLDAGRTREKLLEARKSAYPMTPDRTRCAGCQFLELCRPDQAAEVAGLGDGTAGEERAG